jgi:AAA ATPase-like protein
VTVLLLGRDRELAELEEGLGDARTGRGRLFMLAGEPGIGKTRLAEALSERAEAEGMVALWGRCWDTGGAPSYWPWVQALRTLVRDRDIARLEQELDGNAGWIAQLLPDLRLRMPDVQPPGSLDSDQARFALFDAIASFLRRASSSEPLVIVLDDLHAADQGSLLLLEFLAHAIRDTSVMVLATYQQAAAARRPELERLIGVLGRESRAIALQGFGPDELTQLLEYRGAETAPPELVRALHATTEGNPFFADGVVRLLAAEGRLEAGKAASERFPLPDTVREAIRRRLDPLGPERIATLETAAVIGREFHIATLQLAAGIEREPLIELLDDAVAAGLVSEVHGALGRFRFTHGLIRETLYAGLAAVERVRLHAVVGEALEQRYGPEPERLAELAHHFAAAAPAGDAVKALDYAERAGQQAMEVLAYEDAAQLFELALSTGELVEPARDKRAELLLGLGQARVRSGAPAARDTLLEAAEAAQAVDRTDLLAEAALGVRAFALEAGVADGQVAELLERALDQVGQTDDALRARLLARLALILYHSPADAARRLELVDEAVAVARRLGDRATLAYVLSNGQLATWGPDRTGQLLEWAEELIGLTEEAGDSELALSARNRKIDLLLELDDLPGADAAIEAFAHMARGHPDPRGGAWVPLQRARRALIEGRYEESERLVAEARAVAERLHEATISMLTTAVQFAARWNQGRLDELEEATRRFALGTSGMPVWRVALTVLYCYIGREPDARREFESLARRDFVDVPRVDTWLLSMAFLTDTCAYLGDPRRAEQLYQLLEPFADRNVVTLHAFWAGPVARYLGILASTKADWDRASEHFAAANAAAKRQRARPITALLRLDEARMLASRAEEGDREQALSLLAESGRLAGELEAWRILEQVEELSAALGGPAGPPAEAPSEAPGGPPAPATATLRREGDVWALDFDQREVRVRDGKGIRLLATLLANPGVEIHALELVGGRQAAGEVARAAAGEALESTADDAGPALDAQAKAAYRQRLEELREELEEAEAWSDPERIARAREEMELLTAELAGAVGLGGRDRKTLSQAERARVNATRAIRSVMKRIEEHHPELGRELAATVRTGTFCVHEPDRRRPVSWEVAP